MWEENNITVISVPQFTDFALRKFVHLLLTRWRPQWVDGGAAAKKKHYERYRLSSISHSTDVRRWDLKGILFLFTFDTQFYHFLITLFFPLLYIVLINNEPISFILSHHHNGNIMFNSVYCKFFRVKLSKRSLIELKNEIFTPCHKLLCSQTENWGLILVLCGNFSVDDLKNTLKQISVLTSRFGCAVCERFWKLCE